MSLLSAAEREKWTPFIEQYRRVRARDGFCRTDPDYYRALPVVPPSDPDFDRWRVRQASFAHFRAFLETFAGGRRLRVLDLGAGNGWLSAWLASAGHRPVAVDLVADETDGLGAVRHYETPFVAVQADFESLPVAPHQFDLVVFNGTLHYTRDVADTFRRACRMLDGAGAVAVMDSPLFESKKAGADMVAARDRAFAEVYGLTPVPASGVGYLTRAELEHVSGTQGLRATFVRSRGSWRWEVRRTLDRWRSGRELATFGVWWARTPRSGVPS
ncbi:MAG: class I SAM-dependent methyltransferase [Vicinamibacterales bacterium]